MGDRAAESLGGRGDTGSGAGKCISVRVTESCSGCGHARSDGRVRGTECFGECGGTGSNAGKSTSIGISERCSECGCG